MSNHPIEIIDKWEVLKDVAEKNGMTLNRHGSYRFILQSKGEGEFAFRLIADDLDMFWCYLLGYIDSNKVEDDPLENRTIEKPQHKDD